MPLIPIQDVSNLFILPKLNHKEDEEGVLVDGFIDRNLRNYLISLEDLRHNIGVFGHPLERFRTNLKLIENLANIGYNYILIDYLGEYKRLINVIPSAKVFRLGVDTTLPLLDPGNFSPELYANTIVDIMRYSLNIGDSEYRLLYEGILNLYQQGIRRPTLRELFLAIQDIETKPTLTVQEYAKIDSLYRALYPLFNGRTSAAFGYGGIEGINNFINNGLVIVDLAYITPFRYKILATLLLLYKALEVPSYSDQIIFLDPISSILPRTPKGDLLTFILSIIDSLNNRGAMFHFSAEGLRNVHESLLSRMSLLMLHKTFSEQEFRVLSRFRIYDVVESLPSLSWNELLVLSLGNIHASIISVETPESLTYRLPSDEEIVEHMRKLGYEMKLLDELKLEITTMLERDFKDLANKVYKLLKIIGEHVITRGEAITILKEEGLDSEEATQVLDFMSMVGYIREDYVSGRRCIVLTRKAVIALDEYERKVKSRNLINLRG